MTRIRPLTHRLLAVVAGGVLTVALAAPAAVASPPVVPGAAHAHPGGVKAAYRIGGQRWPGRPARIAYYNATRYKAEVRKAVAAWNASGARLRFVAVSRRRARVVIRYGGTGGPFFCHGRAQLGFFRGHVAPVWLARGCDSESITAIATHELGHIIGLNHEDRRCATMNSSVGARCAQRGAQPWQWRCRLLERDDVRGAVKRYGGGTRSLGAEFCEHPLIAAPTEATVSLGGGYPVLSWRNTANRRLASVRILRRAGMCPTGPADEAAETVYVYGDSRAASAQSHKDIDAWDAGDLCYRLWSIDNYNRPSAGFAEARLNGFSPPDVGISDPVAGDEW